MNARKMTALAMRVLGFWFIPISISTVVQAVLMIGMALKSTATDGKIEAIGVSGIVLLVYPLISLGLIVFADRIARWLVPGEDDEIALAVDARTAHVLAFSVVGVFLVSKGLGSVSHVVLYLVANRETTCAMTGSQSIAKTLFGSVPGVLQFLLGLFLFFRADVLYRLWKKGRPVEEQAEV